MFKIIRSKIFLTIVLLLLAVVGVFYWLKLLPNSKSNNQSVSMQPVLIGADKYKETLGESSKNAGAFYDLYGEAKHNMAAGNYDKAIMLLNQCLSHVELGPEKAMVYRKLAAIYDLQGNLELELKYTELVPKYSANPELNKQYLSRATELRQLIASGKSKPDPVPNP